ncbi:ABC transporter permease [Mycetocola tolaasinivorans]|uniref:ABC transporter permease n=1 Tax=Mycetocola tolaasinivorans TaxID=76635 RepID=A0A3L7A888_9MICO|nr:FtsX-like permease family protein [Mycetocola tolaasinivorans]RLP75582.1 ABC transporter permease [Mycetocola tolaasinivorans]
MRLSLALVLTQDRRSRVRILGIAAGIAIGVMLLLLLWGGYRGLESRSERWDAISRIEMSSLTGTLEEVEPGTGQTLVAGNIDRHREADIQRIDVSSPEGAPPLFHVPVTLPQPGEFLASPALAKRIAEYSPLELGVRFGTLAGTLPDGALPTPDALVAVVAHNETDMLMRFSPRVLIGGPSGEFGGMPVYSFVAVLGALAVAAPVLLLIAIVADLGQASRRERTATLRLLGASRGTVAHLAALEMIPAALVGVLLGAAGAWLTAPLFSLVPVIDGTFFTSDIRVPLAQQIVVLALVAALVPLIAALRAHRTDRGVLPSGAVLPEPVPSFWRLVPLVLGLLGIPAILMMNSILSSITYWLAMFIVLTLICAGLIIAGPYLTYVLGRVLRRGVTSAANVIAVGRTVRVPRATFRAVSGLVIALFLVSMFQIAMTARVDPRAEMREVYGADSPVWAGVVQLENHSGDATLAERRREVMSEVSGVKFVVDVYDLDDGFGGQPVVSAADARLLGLNPKPAQEFVMLNPTITAGVAIHAEDTPVDPNVPRIPRNSLAFTDGSAEAIERTRTAVWALGLTADAVPYVLTEREYGDQLGYFARFSTLASIGAIVAGGISMLALAVATIIGVLDRREVFTRLRLMGVRAGTLRRIILAENVIPLIAMSLLAALVGMFAGWAVIRVFSGGNRQVGLPGEEYAITLLVLASFAALALGLALFSVRGATTNARLREE